MPSLVIVSLRRFAVITQCRRELDFKLMLEQLVLRFSGVADSASFLPVYVRMRLSVLTMGKNVVVVVASSSS